MNFNQTLQIKKGYLHTAQQSSHSQTTTHNVNYKEPN